MPDQLPDWWEYWGSFDWGHAHWAVFCAFARDTDGVTYLLDSCWQRKRTDHDLAATIKATMPERCFGEVYAGQDCFQRYRAHGAPGIQVAEIFEEYGIFMAEADKGRVIGGRALRSALQTHPMLDAQGQPLLDDEGRPRCSSALYFLDTPGNRRVVDQVAETMPDPNNVEEPLKTNSDEHGEGGDDGQEALRYGIATRIGTPADPALGMDEREARKRLDDVSRREAEGFDRAIERAMRRPPQVR